MIDVALTNIVSLEKRRDELAEQLASAEIYLQGEMVNVARQVSKGKSVSPAVTLLLARNELPDANVVD